VIWCISSLSSLARSFYRAPAIEAASSVVINPPEVASASVVE